MISEHNGDLLESGCDVICHQLNLDSIFGGGLAKQLLNKYKDIEDVAQRKAKEKGMFLGSVSAYLSEDMKTTIINCYTQDENYNTRYDAVRSVFKYVRSVCDFASYIKDRIITVGVPYKYGCGIANGDWNTIYEIFKEIFEDDDKVDLQIWKLYDINKETVFLV